MRAEGSKQSVPNAARMAHRKVEDSNQGTFSNNRLAECRSRAKPQRAQDGTSAIRFVPNRSNVEESRLESRDRSPIQLLTKGQRQGTREHPDTNTKRKKKRSERNKKNRNNESLEPEARRHRAAIRDGLGMLGPALASALNTRRRRKRKSHVLNGVRRSNTTLFCFLRLEQHAWILFGPEGGPSGVMSGGSTLGFSLLAAAAATWTCPRKCLGLVGSSLDWCTVKRVHQENLKCYEVSVEFMMVYHVLSWSFPVFQLSPSI
ncbi:hypothetical protein B0H14DRAFT_2634798 [Mycena olivaceomarginata]|nr:hypothetical protein B0H14DRAFT_2634798 [Mycena olivaceomarginata]